MNNEKENERDGHRRHFSPEAFELEKLVTTTNRQGRANTDPVETSRDGK